MNRRQLLVCAVLAVMALIASCGGSPNEAPSPPTATTTEQPSEPTPDRLAATLTRIFVGQGAVTCPGSAPLRGGDAPVCTWLGVGAEPLPVYVSVLDDAGRFVFRGERYGATPADYPAGIISCRTLSEPPTEDGYSDRSPGGAGLDYAMLLHYWMAAGSPAVMDDDRDGVPCETVYPAKIVERVISSPLRVDSQAQDPTALDEVRAYAEAALTGAYGTGELRCETRPGVSLDDLVVAGSVASCGFFADGSPPNYGVSEPTRVVLTVLDAAGRFLMASGGECCGGAPSPLDYPDTGTCASFLTTPPDWGPQPAARHALDFGQVLFWWHWHDHPAVYDSDGDGLPCEDVYPPGVVGPTLDGWLQP